MKLKEIVKILEANVMAGKDALDTDISDCAASDLMSDILARVKTPDLLVTGLANLQAVRTASIFGIKAVVIVRDKQISQNIIDFAESEDIILMVTKYSLFDACGQLYEAGLRSCHQYKNKSS
jgi:predicted transcriptional regulator